MVCREDRENHFEKLDKGIGRLHIIGCKNIKMFFQRHTANVHNDVVNTHAATGSVFTNHLDGALIRTEYVDSKRFLPAPKK